MSKSINAASMRTVVRTASDSVPMAKHANNKSAQLSEDDKTRAVVADVGGTKSAATSEKREKCKEKCPANIKDCCRSAIQGN